MSTKRATFRVAVLSAPVLLTAQISLAQQAGADVAEVVVTGARVSEARAAIGTDHVTATVAITSDALLSAPAGITGLKMLESLPGFNVQANDALGMYEFGNSVSVRAFNFQQIGFLLDDIPMGRSDQFGGSPIYRYVDNENLAIVQASAGAGDVSLPSYSSLGPIVSYITARPADTFGVRLSQTFGSDALRRTFARVETGEHDGFSAYLSGSRIRGDLWRGPGTISRDHVEGKARYRFGESELTLQAVSNDYFDYDSPSITQSQYLGTANDLFGRSGREFSYLDNIPALPQTTPGVPFSNTAYNQFYKQAINSRKDKLYGLSFDTPFTSALSFKSTVYYEDKDGYGVSPEAYATSLASYNNERNIIPGLTAPRGLQYGLSTVGGVRKGVTASSAYELGVNTFALGVWAEKDDYHRTQARYNQLNGDPSTIPLFDEPVHLQRDFVSTRDTLQLFVKDTISLVNDRLKIDLGARSTSIDYKISGYRNPGDYIAQRQPVIRDKWSDNFLPQAGVVFNLNNREQIFASYSENLALPRGADDVFSAASPAVPGPEAERAKNAEIGVRSNRATFNASFAIYATRFENRLQSFASVVPGSTTTETFYQNVGGVKSYGAELSGQWKPEVLGGKVYFNTNLAHNTAEFEDSYSNLAIKGNTLPDFPEWLAQAGVTFEPFAATVLNVSARYIGNRQSNFTNTESVGGYAIVNAYLDIGDGFSAGPFKALKARLNVDNVFDRDYLGTITTTTNTPATFRPGPPRTVQVTVSAEF
ncbi:MAG: TonB-dependent receptor [Gammaproteobacteria bacterium]